MTPNEKINVDVQRQIDTQGSRIDTLVTKIDSFIEESRAARERQDADIREMRQKHDADIKELRQDMKNMQASLDSKIDDMGKHVRNLSVATIVGVATIAITVIYSILTR